MPRGFLRTFWYSSAASFLAAASASLCALDPHTPLAQLGHQAWSIENGLPQNTVPVLLQTRSGYLFAGTETGLAQFDGITFRIWDHASATAFPDAEIRCLLNDATRGAGDNDLWIGTASGLVWMHQGQIQRFTTEDGLPANGIRALSQTSDGTVWAWTEAGISHREGKRFISVPLQAGPEPEAINSIAADSHGRLWAGAKNGFAIWSNGRWLANSATGMKAPGAGNTKVFANSTGAIFLANPEGVFLHKEIQAPEIQTGSWITIIPKSFLPDDTITFLSSIKQDVVAVASKTTVLLVQLNGSASHIIGRYIAAKQLPGSRIANIFADREGTVWIGTNRGLVRILTHGSASRIDHFPPSDPLADSAVLSLLEDREGDLWVGTETDGLHILRDARFHTVSSSEGLSSDSTTAVVEDTHHALWVGTREAGLNRISTTQTTALTTANGLLSNVILSLAPAPDGSLWVGTPDGLNHIGPTHITTYTSADGLPDDFIRSLLADPDGTLWIGTRHGLAHFINGHCEKWNQVSGLGSDIIGALAHSSDGDLWVATLQGLTRIHRGKLRTYTTSDGLSSNVITALAADKDGKLWIGTQNSGLNLWDGQRFIPLASNSSSIQALLPSVVHTLLLDRLGSLWIASDNGLTRVEIDSLLRCAQQNICQLGSNHLTHFTTADGLRSRETGTNSHPTAWRAANGILWFSSPRGIVAADPQHSFADSGPPPVSIERFAVDDHEENLFQISPVAAGHLRFQFDYAGISFSSPHKVRYEYMLEGFDHDWTNAGTRRTAYYTNIPPGKYRFSVRAAMDNADFSISDNTSSVQEKSLVSETSLAFALQPHYYQTLWFGVLVVVAATSLILIFVRSRVSRVARELTAVMAERNRIAREIHDTLAQGYVGISLQLEILGELLRHNKGEAAIRHLSMTQELVRDGLNDARQSIWALRSQDNSESTLPVRIRRVVEQAQEDTLSAAFTIRGIYRPLPTSAEQELLRIAQEAILNVKRHAQATRLDVSLIYDRDLVSLVVTDNGHGFALKQPEHTGDPVQATDVHEGHFGLIGMQERAALLHAEFFIQSQPGSGTTITLRMKADSGDQASSTSNAVS